MKCIICNTENEWKAVFRYESPDKYENWCGLESVLRYWCRCNQCGHYQAWRDYDINVLNSVYVDGYRSKDFRGEAIQDAFNRVASLSDNDREAHRRLMYFIVWGIKDDDHILDFGSGFGIWPYELVKNGFENVTCTEVNKDSLQFINDHLNIRCVEQYTGPEVDVISLVHVLEHFEDPARLLLGLKKHLKPGGKLFIEVPDAFEFKYLPQDHDEFNSCHCHFFDAQSLYAVANSVGLDVTDVHQECYMPRNVSRIMLCTQKSE